MLPLIAGLLLAQPAHSGRLERQLDRYLEAVFAPEEPGATVIVIRDGEVLVRDAYGLADLELQVPMEAEHVLRIGSVTKQFTGAGIALLQQDGVLSVDDPVTRFLPDFDHKVTIRQLLHHTSGVFNYTDDWDYMAGNGIRRELSTDELIEVFADEPLRFEPGSEHEYSNSGYVLLGAVIERASGMPWHAFLGERIFEPLGMADTRGEPATALVPRKASGYEERGGSWHNASFLSMTQPHAAGALVSTVDDLARWSAALDGEELFTAETKRQMWSGTTAGDVDIDYGFGWDLVPVRGRLAQAHRGGVNGYSSRLVRVPSEGIFVAVLGNREDPDLIGHVADSLAAMTLGDPYPTFERITLDYAALSAVGGYYRVSEGVERLVRPDGAGGLVTVRGHGRPMRAAAHGPTAFHYPGTHTWFDFVVEDGEVVAMRMHDGDTEPVVAPRDRGLPVAIELSDEVLLQYQGKYSLREGFTLEVAVQDGQLAVTAPGQEPTLLAARSPTEFFTPELDATLSFEPDGSSFVLYEGGQEYPATRVE